MYIACSLLTADNVYFRRMNVAFTSVMETILFDQTAFSYGLWSRYYLPVFRFTLFYQLQAAADLSNLPPPPPPQPQHSPAATPFFMVLYVHRNHKAS